LVRQDEAREEAPADFEEELPLKAELPCTSIGPTYHHREKPGWEATAVGVVLQLMLWAGAWGVVDASVFRAALAGLVSGA